MPIYRVVCYQSPVHVVEKYCFVEAEDAIAATKFVADGGLLLRSSHALETKFIAENQAEWADDFLAEYKKFKVRHDKKEGSPYENRRVMHGYLQLAIHALEFRGYCGPEEAKERFPI